MDSDLREAVQKGPDESEVSNRAGSLLGGSLVVLQRKCRKRCEAIRTVGHPSG